MKKIPKKLLKKYPCIKFNLCRTPINNEYVLSASTNLKVFVSVYKPSPVILQAAMDLARQSLLDTIKEDLT